MLGLGGEPLGQLGRGSRELARAVQGAEARLRRAQQEGAPHRGG
jgi:hypothetical protein